LSTVGVEVIVFLQDAIETFQLKRFCKLLLSNMLALTNDVDVVLGGVEIVPPVALASDGELPDCVVPGRKKVPPHIRVEFHKARFQFQLVADVLDMTYLNCSPTGPITIVPEGTPVTLNS
jgi:hypothetical protein